MFRRFLISLESCLCRTRESVIQQVMFDSIKQTVVVLPSLTPIRRNWFRVSLSLSCGNRPSRHPILRPIKCGSCDDLLTRSRGDVTNMGIKIHGIQFQYQEQ
jgi:hypothetical protein